MLHSTLPRAFLPPGLNYLGGYYGGDDGHVYSTATHYVPCLEDQRIRVAAAGAAWGHTAPRPISPSPLDLSLKPPPPPGCDREQAIEVDDDEEAASAAAAAAAVDKRSFSNNSEESRSSGVNELQTDIGTSLSVQSYHSYVDMIPINACGSSRRRDSPTSPTVATLFTSFEALAPKKQVFQVREPAAYRNHQPVFIGSSSSSNNCQDPTLCSSGDQRKLQLSSPSDSIGTQHSYHHHHHHHHHQQQLLSTPQHHGQAIDAPMTPPSTPSPPQCPRRRPREESMVTPSPHRSTTSPKSSSNHQHNNHGGDKVRAKKKHARRLKFDEDTSSPVSGTVILGPDEAVVTGDIDPAFNIVEVTEEARAELAKIENRLGPYQCKLCRQLHDDAFQLAQHRCSRIAHVEYRCPECDKRFSCPANLASHRRWHKPRMPNGAAPPDNVNGLERGSVVSSLPNASGGLVRETEISCTRCDVKFTRAAALRKHLATQHPGEANNNLSGMTNNNSGSSNDNCNDRNSGLLEELDAAATAATMTGKPLCQSMNLASVSLSHELP